MMLLRHILVCQEIYIYIYIILGLSRNKDEKYVPPSQISVFIQRNRDIMVQHYEHTRAKVVIQVGPHRRIRIFIKFKNVFIKDKALWKSSDGGVIHQVGPH